MNSFGPQRGPATTARLRAQWRQIDTENREATTVRQQWMKLLGCDQSEINDACNSEFAWSLQEELDQLSAVFSAKKLQKSFRNADDCCGHKKD